MKDQRHNTRHHVALILALVGLIGAAALLLNPSRRASAQAVAPSWTYTGSRATDFNGPATLLPDGKVLVAGGYSVASETDANSADLYDPATGTWSKTGNLNEARRNHTATLLPNGKVLVAGGGGCVPAEFCWSQNSAELYDPAIGTWSFTGRLNRTRKGHTATLLPSGKVLVAGGSDDALSPSELYDPATGTWSVTGNLNIARFGHTATLLPNGKVLVVGGNLAGNTPELYDPVTGTWSFTGSLNTARIDQTATLLADGRVLIAGGFNGHGYPNSAELYDAATGTWSLTGSLNVPRAGGQRATLLPNGKVLVAGDSSGSSSSAELYDPNTGLWSITASLNEVHWDHGATLLLNGKVLVTGPYYSAELYDPGTSESATPTPTPTATPTPTPTPTPTATPTATPTPAVPTWTVTGNLNTGRDSQTATLLPNGKVLVAGGNNSNGTLKSAELYDPANGTWSISGNLNTSRAFHTATLLPNGKVLAAGGFSCGPPPQTCADVSSAELYDPATGIWTNTGNLNAARSGQTATLLSSGKVLVAAGFFNNSELNTAELYDPGTGTWSVTGNLNVARFDHTSTLLPGGEVIVAGGANSAGSLNSAELYNPTAGTWSITGNLNTTRQLHTATLLPNGRVLVAAGFIDFNTGAITNSAELYDPTTGVWTNTGNLNRGRSFHTATLLMTGKVLIAGGFFIDGLPNITDSCELYDPATGTWSNTTHLNIGRRFHTATLLQTGKVLAAGGSGFNAPNSAELYDPGANPINDAAFFITQQYRDFLGREPDSIGLQNWIDTLTNCPNGGYGEFDNPSCDRVHVSAGFFQSNEFLGRGYWILRFGFVALDRSVGATRSSATYAEFTPALQQIGGSNSPAQEETAKTAYTNAFVQRADFQALFPASLSNSQYVNGLELNAGVTLTNKQALIDALQNMSMTRADVLRSVVESQVVFDKFIIPSFVTMEYFGYLRRDVDETGYRNWVDTLTADPSNYRHMIFGFIYSTEYRSRFGSP